MLDQLLADATLTTNAKAKQGLDEMGILFTFLDAYRITDKVGSFQDMGTYRLNLVTTDLVRLVVSTRAGLLYRPHL